MEENKASSSISVRMDTDLKTEFEALCQEFGINTSTAITMFAKAVVRERQIPFAIKAAKGDPFHSDANQRRVRRSIQSFSTGRTVVRNLSEVKDETNLDE